MTEISFSKISFNLSLKSSATAFFRNSYCNFEVSIFLKGNILLVIFNISSKFPMNRLSPDNCARISSYTFDAISVSLVDQNVIDLISDWF